MASPFRLAYFIFFPYNKNMIKIDKKVPLGPLTTMKIGSLADFFTIVRSEAELKEALAWAKKNKQTIFVLGGGSNTLFAKPFKGLVIKNEIQGLKIIKKTKSFAWLESASGESWARFINFNIKNNLFGLENLFLIPGTVGAAPVQNIGAYGVEIKDNFVSLRALDLKTGQEKIMTAAACRFGYRDSVFKNKYRGRYFILSLIFKMSLEPKLRLEYRAIPDELKVEGILKPTLRDIVNIIHKLRSDKLPNLALFPNAGSFFKNPTISEAVFKKLKTKFPDIKSFTDKPGKIKIPAAWLIEQAGFKGRKIGRVGMYEKQALILVNYGGASAKEVLRLAYKIQIAVKKKFGLELELEVNIV